MSQHGEVRARFRILGRVQGVGFRWWAAREARALALAGTVQNERDGSVEVEVEGPAMDLEQFRELLEQGPPGATVDRVQEVEPTRGPLPTPFSIRA
ncbi:MAG TPA: acylphosphatase [Longimicrobiales bacterium]